MESISVIYILSLMYVFSLDRPIGVDEYGDILTLADIIPDDRQNVEETVSRRELLESLPYEILQIGEKMIDRDPLTQAKRKRLERFRRRNNFNAKEVE